MLRTLRPKQALGSARTWAEAGLACPYNFSPPVVMSHSAASGGA